MTCVLDRPRFCWLCRARGRCRAAFAEVPANVKAPDPRPWRQRFWARLGFGECRAPYIEDREGFAPGCGDSSVHFDVDWRDRLRLLVSGRLAVSIAHKMDALPRRWESAAAMSVLPPGAAE